MAGEKTEKATPKRRRDERKKGNVLMSKDVTAVATLIGSYAMIQLVADSAIEQLEQFWNLCFSYIGTNQIDVISNSLAALGSQALLAFASICAPLLLVTALITVAVTFYQTKLLVSGELLKPKFDRLNPLNGIKRLFSLRSIIEALKGILKISILLILIINYFRDILNDFPRFLELDLASACSILFQDILSLVMQIIVAFVAIAFLDYLYQWWDYERQMKMSKEDIKEEYKQTEGDPKIKGKIKQIQRQRAQQRMMQQVPQADVVIRNPTHFAVALRYDEKTDRAPIVLAKGMDELALRIVKVAEEHQVSVVENVPLARALYASTDLEREIPPELYGAVAEVLVYVLKLNKKH